MYWTRKLCSLIKLLVLGKCLTGMCHANFCKYLLLICWFLSCDVSPASELFLLFWTSTDCGLIQHFAYLTVVEIGKVLLEGGFEVLIALLLKSKDLPICILVMLSFQAPGTPVSNFVQYFRLSWIISQVLQKANFIPLV